MAVDAKEVAAARVPICDRLCWGALAPKAVPQLMVLPVKLVTLFYSTGSSPCPNHEQCVKTLQNLQKAHFERDVEDISFNFMIGSDGSVYEGRGWQGASLVQYSFPYSHIEGRSLDIAYIGKYTDDEPPGPRMIDAKDRLLKLALLNRYLDPEFTVREEKSGANAPPLPDIPEDETKIKRFKKGLFKNKDNHDFVSDIVIN